MRPGPHRLPAVVATVLATAVLALSACGADDAPEAARTVTLGGTEAVASTETVERPWGTVKVFPEMQKAEEPDEADAVFTQEMVMHHEQAIELSRNLLRHDGVDDRIVASARFIVEDQRNEISVMTSWLEAWGLPVVTGDEHAGHHRMPGMLPQERVDAIASLSTQRAQVAFLVAMIEHHEGAIEMSQDYLPRQGNTYVRSTAQHIIAEQRTEVQYMQNVVDELCAGAGPRTCPSV